MKKIKFLSMSVFVIVIFLLILLGKKQYFEEASSVKKEENNVSKDVYYEINETEIIKYSFPNRPFDTVVTLEGVGWQDGKFIAVISTKFLNETYYSYMPRFFSPTLEFENNKYILMDKVWTEGALEGHKGSVSRYAVTSNRSKFPRDFWPEKITILGTEFKIPDQSSTSKKLTRSKVEKQIKYDLDASLVGNKVTYNLKSLDLNKIGGQMSIEINALDANLKENNVFILKDDFNRMYSFKKRTLPSVYKKGVNTYMLELNQPIIQDIKTLEFIVFQDDFLQSHLYTSSNEKKVLILQK